MSSDIQAAYQGKEFNLEDLSDLELLGYHSGRDTMASVYTYLRTR
jgi:hypothetical protein